MLNFELPSKPVSFGGNAEVEYLPFQANGALDQADGLIIPQGIFEKISYKRSYMGTHTEVRVQTALLQERQKQVFNMIEDGRWVCFLVGCIFERLRIVNTVFELPFNREKQFRIIAESGSEPVAIEWTHRLFFLPLQNTKRDAATLNLIVTEVSTAILDYRQKRIAEVPAWLDELKFATEERLDSEVEALQKQIADREGQIQTWKDYKAILSTSGEILKERVVAILRGFFGFKVGAPEEFREDAKILDDHTGETVAFVEIKGTKAGIKREHINQVDSHRERAGLSVSMPGVLIINNEMSVSGIKERFETTVPVEQIDHAKKLNVLIIRTIDLLFLIRQFEDRPDKKETFLEVLRSGGG